MRSSLTGIVAAALLAACSTSKSDNATPDSLAVSQPDSARPIASPGGFTGPEAVRYDPDQDVYFGVELSVTGSSWPTGSTLRPRRARPVDG